MTTTTATRLLVSLLILSGLAAAACDENVLDPMADRQRKTLRYKESSFYDDKLSMRAPPEGTVPRERVTLNPRLTTGRESDGPMQPNGEPLPVYTTNIPMPISRKLLDLGRKRYDITCGTCHGTLGDGDSIVARQMSLHPPPSLHKYVNKPSGYLYEVATKGFGMMASYAAELTVEERWAVVAYIRALQISQLTAAAELPPEERQKLEALPPGVLDPPLPKRNGNGHTTNRHQSGPESGHGKPSGAGHEQPSHEEKR
jgi:hypothetical protein